MSIAGGTVGSLVELDVDDDRCKSTCFAMWRKDKSGPAVLEGVDIMRRVLDDLGRKAGPEDWHTPDRLWVSAII